MTESYVDRIARYAKGDFSNTGSFRPEIKELNVDPTNDKLDKLIKDVREGPKYGSAWEWSKAVDAYKKKHGTTVGFQPEGGRLQFTDSSGQVWNYAHGSKKTGGKGRPRTAEATDRFLSNRSTAVKENKLSLKDYIEAFSPDTGKALFEEHKGKLKKIKETNKNNPGFDADHIRPASEGGAELPKTYRMQNRSRNRSEQARELNSNQRSALLIEGTPKQQLRSQGPLPTPRQRQIIINKGVATFVPQQGWQEQLAAPKTIDTDPLGGMGLPISGV